VFLKTFSANFPTCFIFCKTPKRAISPSQGLCLHRTAHYRNTKTHIHALSGVQIHSSSAGAAKSRALDRVACMTYYKVKSKTVPLPPCRRQWGEVLQILLILDLRTRWGCVVSFKPRPPFATGRGPPVLTGYKAGWASEQV
jgi:hypothetical protein